MFTVDCAFPNTEPRFEAGHCRAATDKGPCVGSVKYIEDLLADGVPRRLHALGITGIGLSGVSALFKSRGWNVSGCDALPAPEIVRWLSARGIPVETGHAAAHIADTSPDLVLFSPAVAPDHPEMVAAKEHGIPVVRRGEALAALVNLSNGVAVCGTHGKTTTSCFTRTLLAALGAGPSWCIGGYTASMGGVAGVGANDTPLVVEADESDGTLALYRPQLLVVTSVEPDHMEHFASFDHLKACFATAARATSKAVVVCADDANACEIAASATAPVFSYGVSSAADFRCEIKALEASRSLFSITFRGELFSLELGVPGRHNVLNATAAFTACVALGYAPAEVAQAVSALTELPGRRFETFVTQDGVRIVSDYSHHPTEIAALVATAKLSSGRLTAVFQPHRYTRTRALAADFPRAFRGVDELLLLPVYAASEKPLPGGSSEDLYRVFREQNAADPSVPRPMLVPSVAAAKDYLVTRLRRGETLLVVGAGNVVSLVSAMKNAALTPSEPSRVATSFGVGGTADWLVEAADTADLQSILATAARDGQPVRVIGQGTNVLVSDCGMRGVTVKLATGGFGFFERQGESVVRVGCAMAGAKLLALLRDEGLSGLEFMAGIPGCVGGWLAMNAGTRFGEFGDRVEAFSGVDFNGCAFTVAKADAGFAYRACATLENRIALQVTLSLTKGEPDEITRKMDEFRAKRFNFAGLRTAGSVFRNPEGTTAGKLLDACGCKGLRVGGAVVCDRHANIIAAEPGGTASDIIALSSLMRDKVAAQFGIDLHREIRIW